MPPHYFGLNLPNLYWEQGCTAINAIMDISWTPGDNLFYTSLEQGQLELGIGTPLFEADYPRLSHLLTDAG